MTNLTSKRLALEAAGTPIQVGLIGAGKFGSMFISQAHRTPGLRLAGIADLSKERAFAALKRTGYPEDRVDWDGALGVGEGIQKGKTVVTTDSAELIKCGKVDVVLEVTGSPAAGVRHALMVCARSDSDLRCLWINSDWCIVLRVQNPYCHGQRRSRCTRRTLTRTKGKRSRHHLLHGLRRPTSPYLRAGRLGKNSRLVRTNSNPPNIPLPSNTSPATSSAPAKAPNTSPTSTNPPQPQSGTTTASRNSNSRPAISTRRCSTPSSTARNPR